MRRCLILLALASCERWTKQDTALELAFVGATAADWRQTIDITQQCDETNPMIGPCGETVPPDLYFPVAIVVHAAIAACLPPTWRTVFQAFSTGLEVSTVVANHNEGFHMQ